MTTQDEKPGQVPDSELVHGHPYVIDPDTGLRATLDGVPYAAAHADDEALIETQKRQQAEMEVPLLAGKDNPNAFVFLPSSTAPAMTGTTRTSRLPAWHRSMRNSTARSRLATAAAMSPPLM